MYLHLQNIKLAIILIILDTCIVVNIQYIIGQFS